MTEQTTDWQGKVGGNETPKKRQMIYIAGPYTKPLNGKDVRFERNDMLTRAGAEYMNDGHLVYSPITHTHPLDQCLAKANSDPKGMGSNYWVDLDESFMQICDRCVVVKLPGWDDSSGVKREIAWFTSHGKPVDYVEPTDYVLGKTEVMQRGLIAESAQAKSA